MCYYIRLKIIPTLIVRYFPLNQNYMYEYRFYDQVDHDFDHTKYKYNLTLLHTKFKKFKNIINVFLFLTQAKIKPTKDLEDVFEISKDKKTWTTVKRPLIHAPCQYMQTVHTTLPKNKNTIKYSRRRGVPTHGFKKTQKHRTTNVYKRNVSTKFFKKIQNKISD